jgi:hypothetical protein
MAVGPLLNNHNEIWVTQTKNDTTEQSDAPLEAAGQTFLKGTPVMLNGAGYVQAWDGETIQAGIYAISGEDAHNLASAGLGAPGAFTPVGFPGTGVTFGKVPYQPSAVNIPEGAPPSLGYIIVAEAIDQTIFMGQCDNSVNNAAVTPTQATIAPGSNQYGMTLDANGHWYIDLGKNTPGVNAVLTVVGFSIDGLIANARLLFVFNRAASQASN